MVDHLKTVASMTRGLESKSLTFDIFGIRSWILMLTLNGFRLLHFDMERKKLTV
jgi:hypothetical protein